MALQFQNYNVSFFQGLDTKSDRLQVPAGKLDVLVNADMSSPGAIQKRFGNTSLSLSIDGGGSISNSSALTTYRGELLNFANRHAYSLFSSNQKWSDRGVAVSVAPEAQSVIANTDQQSNSETVLSNGIKATVYQDTRGGIRYSVIDAETGAFIISDQVLTSKPGAFNPRACALNGRVYVFFGDTTTNQLYYNSFPTSNPRALDFDTSFDNLNVANPAFDALSFANRIYVCHNSSGGSNLKMGYIDSSGSIVTGGTISATTTKTIGLWSGADGNLYAGTYQNGDSIIAFGFNQSLSVTLSGTTVANTSTDDIRRVTGVEFSPGRHAVFFDRPSNFVVRAYTKTVQFTTAGVVTGLRDFMRDTCVYSRPFAYGGSAYVVLSSQSTNQSCYYVADLDRNVVSRIAYQVGGGHRLGRCVTSVSQDGGRFIFAIGRKGRLYSEDESEKAGARVLNKSGLFTLNGVQNYTLDFTGPQIFQTAELGDNLFVAGGVVQTYDGNRFRPVNFHRYPDEDRIRIIAGEALDDGYDVTAGSYQYSVIYQDTDSNGHIVRSTPSVPLTYLAYNKFEDGYTATLEGPTLRITGRDNVEVVIYRTERNGTSFYRVTSILAPLYNDPTVDAWTFVDDVGDDVLISRELLYTTGGVLDNAPPPPAKLICTYDNRLWLAGLEDPQEIAYSQDVISKESVNFAPAGYLSLRCDERGGKITALFPLNGDLIIFKERALFRTAGPGPNNTGSGSQYAKPQMITSDVGCTNPNSIAMTDQGLLFQSSKGIFLLSTSLQPIYIGAPVERYNDLQVTSTTVVAEQNFVIFTTETDTALVWYYDVDQWGTFSNHASLDSLIYQGKLTLLKTNGKVWQQTPNQYADEGAFVPLKIRTSYLSVGGPMAWMRVRQLAFMGEFKSRSSLLVSVGRDMGKQPTIYERIDPTQLFNDNLWGSGDTWGSDEVWGGQYQAYMFKDMALPSSIQQCTSISIGLEDEAPTDGSTDLGISLSGIALYLAIKPGLFRPVPKQRFGS